MCASQLYETAVTYEVAYTHTHILPVFNTGTLMFLLLDLKKKNYVSTSFVDSAKKLSLQNLTLAVSPLQATSSEVDTHSGCIIR